MQDTDVLFDALRHSADPTAVTALEDLVRDGHDSTLARLNALTFAAAQKLDEDKAITALLQAARLGLFEMSWNILCPSCGGVLDANTTLKTIRQTDYHCAFCDLTGEPNLDDAVEVTFAISPRVRRIAAHDPNTLPFWDYHRQVFFGSGMIFPEAAAFAALAKRTTLEAVELGGGERMILSLQLGAEAITIFDPVTHTAHFVTVEGQPTTDRQELGLIFDNIPGATVSHSTMRPGPLRLSLDNRTAMRVLPGVFVHTQDLELLLGQRGPYLTAKRLLCNQTFRDIYRTETLDVDQRLKILSLTFLFTDLTGSTALYEKVGDLVAYDLVRAHFRVLDEIVASEGGAVVKTIGDAVMATFPAPQQALKAALRMRRSMQQLNDERPDDALVLKIGIHVGPCLAVSFNDRQDYFGQTVNIASRVQELAGADRIYATGSVVDHPNASQVLTSQNIATERQTEILRGIGVAMPIYALS